MSTKKMQIIGLKGKSAYQYAQDGGYTGTEAEFKDKMAKELDVVYDYEDLNEAILATAIKPEASGEFIHITDSAALPIMDFGMEGKTEQNTVAGNQLFELTNNYLWGYITANNSKITDWQLNAVVYIPCTSNTTYTISGRVTFSTASNVKNRAALCESIPQLGSSVYGMVECSINDPLTITTDENAKYLVIMAVTDGDCTIDNREEILRKTVEKLMVNEDNVAKPYEPYTGAQPSPNPDYPQEIINAGTYNEATGRYEIGCRVCTGNLFDVDSFAKTCEQTVNDDGTISISANSAKYFFDLPDIPTVFSWEFVTTTNTGVAELKFVFKDGSFAYLSNSNTSVKLTKQLDYVTVLCYAPITVKNLKLEYGDTSSTEYAQHSSQPFTLTSPVPITKWDKLVKRDGVWGWSIQRLLLTFDGNIDWVFSESLLAFYAECLPESMATRQSGFCNQLRVAYGWNDGTNDRVYIGNNNKNIIVYNPSYHDDTLADFGVANWKAHLNENPLEIWTYADREQSFHPLPESEQALLKSLETYYQVTNIYNDQNCPMSIQYIADTQTYIDNLANELTNAVVSLGGEV